MSASSRLGIGVVAFALTCLVLSYAVAQQEQSGSRSRDDQSREHAAGQSDASPGQAIDRTLQRAGSALDTVQRRIANFRGESANSPNQAVEHFLANCLLGQNQAEVQLSELGKEKSENAEVKQFAQQMIKDHQKLIEQLQPLAGMQTGTNPANPAAASGTTNGAGAAPASTTTGQPLPPSSTAAAGTTGTPGATETASTTNDPNNPAAAGGALHQLMQIEKQIDERCLQMAKDELQQKSGAEFDKCFVGYAIGAHNHALAALEVIGQQGPGQLAQVAQAAQPTVKQHLENAQQLMKQLESRSGSTATQAERPSSRTER